MCLLWTLAQRAAEVCSERAPTAPRSPPHAAGRVASPSLRRAIIWLAGQTPADSVKRRAERLVPALRSPSPGPAAPGRCATPGGAEESAAPAALLYDSGSTYVRHTSTQVVSDKACVRPAMFRAHLTLLRT